MVKPLFKTIQNMIVILFITLGAYEANSQESSVDSTPQILANFANLCERLEAQEPRAMRVIIKLEAQGYFSTFCHTVGFQTCQDFNYTVKKYGYLEEKGSNGCSLIPSVDSRSLVSH